MGFHSESTSRTSSLRRAFAALATRRPAAKRAVRRAACDVIEQLESRRLLAVVNAGETAFYYNGTNSYVIQVTGSGSFTFTAAFHPDTGPGIALGEVPLTVTGGAGGTRQYNGGYHTTAPSGGGTLPKFDIYSILSADTSANTSLSITQFTPATAGTDAFSTPFSTGAGALITNLADAGQKRPVTLTLNHGGVFIGGRSNTDTAGVVEVLTLTKTSSIASSNGVGLRNGQALQPGIFITGVNNKLASVNRIFIAGTITGRVLVTGSVNTFYAGNILTGDVISGKVANNVGAQNFRIGGDLRNLIVSGGIGTVSGAPDAFLPGTDLSIGGRVQQVKTGVEFRGSIDVGGGTGTYTDGSDLVELESRDVGNATDADIGASFDNFQLLNQDVANNDSFDTPQILGEYKSDATKEKSQITLTGSINNGPRVLDDADYYGVPLLAGQTINVRLVSQLGNAYVAVYDPDNRLIATDRSNQNNAAFQGQTIQIHATTAGLYRVAALPVLPTTRTGVDRLYTLTIGKLGDVGIGGLASLGDVYLSNLTTGFRVRSGDLGALLAAGHLYGGAFADATTAAVARDAKFNNPIITNGGNIRAVTASTFSFLRDGVYDLPPNIIASKSVGRLQTSGYMYFNFTGLNSTTQQPSSNLTIGGDYQVIQSGADFSANLSANGGIGVIRAQSVSSTVTNFPGYFEINADGKNDDGFIGLIDVANDFGRFEFGGPAISSGRGSSSNVKYMRVGGTVYRDAATGAGQSNVIEATDKSVDILDDSGATVTLTPIVGDKFDTTPDTTNGSNGTDTNAGSGTDDTVIGSNGGGNPIGSNPNMPNPIGTVDTTNGSNGTDTTTGSNGGDVKDTRPRTASGRLIGGQLIVSTYPTRNGGSIIFRVQATDPTTANRQIGVDIVTTGKSANASGDIGELITTNNGNAEVIDPDPLDDGLAPSAQAAFKYADTGTNLEVLASGVRTNIFSIRGPNGALSPDFTTIFNGTDGEIVNLNADSVGTLEAQYIGVSRSAGGVQLDGFNNAAGTTNVYPFNQTKNSIKVGNALSIRSRGPIGNVIANEVNLLQANADNKNVKGVNEGIVAPILATEEFRAIDIGEGLASSGSGEASLGGIYTNGQIGSITNANGGGDLRGDVISNYLENITLGSGGSIVDADILEGGTGGFTVGFETNSFLINADTTTQLDGIGDINISGTGGIINSRFLAQNMGLTTVSSQGFGVLNSTFFASGGGTMKGLFAGGLGIRNSQYTGGAFVGDVVATGGGGLVDLNSLTTSIRGSESNYADPSTGISFNAANDVYRFFQTTSDNSKIVGVTNSGIIADTTIVASRSVNSVRAFDFRTFNSGALTAGDEAFPSTINFANSIGSIAAKRNIDGLRVVGGSIGSISAGGTISHFQLQARARVGSVNAKKNILGTANFNVTDEGSIGTFAVNGYMNGTIFSQQGIGSIIIDGNLRADRSQGGIYTPGTIELLKVGGSVLDGSYVRAKRSIKSIQINGDFQSGAVIRSAKISKQSIRGHNDGSIQIS